MLSVALLLALPLVFAAALSSIIRQNAGPLIRAVFVSLPIAGLGTGVAVSITTLALSATDALCAAASTGTSSTSHALFTQLAQTLDAGVPGAGGFGAIVVALVVALGAFLLTLELIVRSAAVYVAMLFLPLALAGLVWPATARWGKRLAEMLVALILSKFVMVAVISLAVAALAGGLSGQGLSGLLTGAALLLLATVAPFALLRMAPIVEAGAIAHLDGAGRRAASAPGQAVDAASQAHANVARVLDRVGGGGPPGGGPTADSGSSIPVERSRVGLEPDGTQAPASGAAPRAIEDRLVTSANGTGDGG
jgi:hypothetical protein